MAVRTYDPKQVSVIVAGNIAQGFADGEFINVSRDNDSFGKVVGADGITSRSKLNDRSATMVLTLAQTSPTNAILSALLNADELTGTGIFPVIVKENAGGSILESALGWIRKPADTVYGKEISNREWTLDLADHISVEAGNANFEPVT